MFLFCCVFCNFLNVEILKIKTFRQAVLFLLFYCFYSFWFCFFCCVCVFVFSCLLKFNIFKKIFKITKYNKNVILVHVFHTLHHSVPGIPHRFLFELYKSCSCPKKRCNISHQVSFFHLVNNNNNDNNNILNISCKRNKRKQNQRKTNTKIKYFTYYFNSYFIIL